MKSARYAGLIMIASAAGFSVMLQPLATSKTVIAQAPQAPMFEVDPFWPKPLPHHHWVTGSTIGLSVDAQDNVWTIYLPDAVGPTSRQPT